MLARLNRHYAAARPGDSRLEARISSYELAARMQVHAPEALDLNRESACDPPTLRTRRLRHRRLRPALLARSTAARARRPVRAGLERRRRTERQLGQPRQYPHRVAGDRAASRSTNGRAARRSEGARPARRHAGRLEHRVWPAAVHPGQDRPRSQCRHECRLARRRGREARRRLRGERPVVVARAKREWRTATTSTPRSCTCWGSITSGSPSETPAPIGD